MPGRGRRGGTKAGAGKGVEMGDDDGRGSSVVDRTAQILVPNTGPWVGKTGGAAASGLVKCSGAASATIKSAAPELLSMSLRNSCAMIVSLRRTAKFSKISAK